MMSNRYLSTDLRRAMEKAVRVAREMAEEGARDAIRAWASLIPKPRAI
jgi:hypothetical protein